MTLLITGAKVRIILECKSRERLTNRISCMLVLNERSRFLVVALLMLLPPIE